MILEKMLMGATSEEGYSPNAVKLDGANDYLSSAALTGIADSKSGIFSCWVRVDVAPALKLLLGGYNFDARYSTTGVFSLNGWNAAVAKILDIRTSAIGFASARWIHLLASWDLAAGVSSIYVNDTADQTVATRTNDTIDYNSATDVGWSVGSSRPESASYRVGGALSEFYFAPGQYLDFSTESNRRKFISATGYPVSLGSDGSTPTATAPIIYLKGNASAFGVNSGTGGNFTVNGTLEKASTTPATIPAFNAILLDGTSDYLSKASALSGVSDGKTFILSMWIRFDNIPVGHEYIIDTAGSGRVTIYKASGGYVSFEFLAVSGGNALIASFDTAITASSKWRHLLVSVDLTNSANRGAYLDGATTAVTWSTYTNTNTGFGTSATSWYLFDYKLGSDGTYRPNYGISELYFAPNQYLDLSVQANREKFILAGAPVSLGSDGSTPTGVAPAIYLPNRAALVGTNAGTGGNFTINGAPKDANSTPVYYYAEPATFDGTNDYLSRGAGITGIADAKTGTVSFWIRVDGAAATLQRIFANLVGTLRFHVSRDASNKIVITGNNAAGAAILVLTSTTSYSMTALWVHVIASWDLAATTGHLYINNADDKAGGATLTNDTIDYVTATPNWALGANTDGTNKTFATISDFWFNTTYLDISQSANRAKFIDQTTLRPVALGAKGELPTGSQPLLYLGRDFSNFQTNLGSGGAFTVTGALTRGTTSPSDVRA